MNLKKVLVIDDDNKLIEKVSEEFTKNNVDIEKFNGYDEFEKKYTPTSDYQMIVLDWLLDSTDSSLSRLVLQKIRETKFIPVVVWTGEKERFEGESQEVYKLFPQSCMHVYSKKEVDYTNLLAQLNEWHSKPPMNLSESFKSSLASAYASAFYNLAEHSTDDLAKGLKVLIAQESQGTEIDIEHPIDVLLRLIAKSMYKDDKFINELRSQIKQLRIESSRDKKAKSKIIDHHMFYQPRDDDTLVRAGDIVSIIINKDAKIKAIVLTPACDLAVPGKTKYLRLVKIHDNPNPSNKTPVDKWPFIEDGNHQLVSHHEVMVLLNETIHKINGKPDFVMSYQNEYSSITGSKIELSRLKRLDEPYRSDLFHHFVSHAGRIGVPDFVVPQES